MSCEISRLVKQLVVKGFVFHGNLYVVVVFLDVFNAILFEGMDYYWVSTCLNDKPLRYSDFNIGEHERNNKIQKDKKTQIVQIKIIIS